MSCRHPLDKGRNGFWRNGASAGDLQPPDGTVPFADYVSGAPTLTAALAGVGIVDDAESAAAKQFSLRPGQAVATRDGGLWRWDGL